MIVLEAYEAMKMGFRLDNSKKFSLNAGFYIGSSHMRVHVHVNHGRIQGGGGGGTLGAEAPPFNLMIFIILSTVVHVT